VLRTRVTCQRAITPSTALLATAVVAVLSAPAQASPRPPREILAARDSVVRVTCGDGTGTGFLYGARDRAGTAFHVVASGRSVRVTFRDGSSTGATVAAYDRDRDLAILQLERPGPGAALDRDRQTAPSVGDAVFAVGHPMFQIDPDWVRRGLLEWTVTGGMVSAVSPDVVQTDAAVNAGNSGGPLLSEDGRVIGVLVQKSGEGLAFAVRAHLLDEVVARLGRQEPYRGEWKLRVSAGFAMAFERGQGAALAGLMAGVGGIAGDRFLAMIRAGQLQLMQRDRPVRDGVLERSLHRTIVEGELAYSVLLGRKAHRVNLGAGAALLRDSGHESALQIELKDPMCDIATQPCETITTSRTTDVDGDWSARPLVSAALVMWPVTVSVHGSVDLDAPRRSELRFMLSAGF
jgi:hypothetical protein